MKLCVFTPDADGTTATCLACGFTIPAATRLVIECGVGQQHAAMREFQDSPPRTDGPGTRLKTLLRDWLGIEASPTCKCNGMAAKMDSLGPDWCESDEGMAAILDVMRDEHARRWAEGLTVLPWADFAARRLVLLACRQARSAARDLEKS
jgi:hypothetical protein